MSAVESGSVDGIYSSHNIEHVYPHEVPAVLAELGHVAEGVASAAAVRALARAHGTEMPITEAVNQVLFEGLAPGLAVQRLLARDPRAE